MERGRSTGLTRLLPVGPTATKKTAAAGGCGAGGGERTAADSVEVASWATGVQQSESAFRRAARLGLEDDELLAGRAVDGERLAVEHQVADLVDMEPLGLVGLGPYVVALP